METNQNQEKTSSSQKKGGKTVVFFVIILLLLANGLLLWKFFAQKAEKVVLTQKVVATTTSLDSVTTEYKQVKASLEKIQQDNVGLQSKLSENDEKIKEQASKIERLIREKQSIDVIKDELAKLKDLKTQYETKIAELEKTNQELTNQNQNLNTNLSLAKVKNENLAQENVTLSTKVAIGSILKADGIKVLGVKFKSSGKEVETNKSGKVQKIKTCFSIIENLVAEKGKKDIYIRILGPEGSCLSASSETFSYKGQQTIYTMKQEINFDNKKQDICVYWEKGSVLSKGKYTLEIYADGNQIGTGDFELK